MEYKKIILFLFLLGASFLQGQTPGFNYQAVILNTSEIEIPGTNVKENQLPLGLEDITFRFSISNKNNIEYSEEQTVTTDASGMVSLIVGEGTPISATFNDIVWDGEEKYLKVEIDILSNNDGFIILDEQKILYIPPPIRNSTTAAKEFITIAVDNQKVFTTPSSIYDYRKIDVYRNGARISFTIKGANTIQIDKGITCYQGDEIRIVQIE